MGDAAISACVYGCIGSEHITSVGPHSTIFPRYIIVILSLI